MLIKYLMTTEAGFVVSGDIEPIATNISRTGYYVVHGDTIHWVPKCIVITKIFPEGSEEKLPTIVEWIKQNPDVATKVTHDNNWHTRGAIH